MVLTTKRTVIIKNSQPIASQLLISSDLVTTNPFEFQASISPKEKKQPDSSPPPQASQSPTLPVAVDEKGKRVNAIFLGIPGKGNNAPKLTDTLMIMSIDEKTKEGFLLSIPRDLFVRIPGTNIYTKINALYQKSGIGVVKTVLAEITGLDFDYNIVIDLEGVKKIIDQVGGIDILVERDIYDPAFPGPNNSYQLFILEAGWQHLDGETALKYIRTRHDPTGDFARMHRQQQVLTALQEKISSLHPIWNLAIVLNIWRTITSHFKANLTLENIKTFWEIAKYINLEKIEFRVLDSATGLVAPGYTFLGSQRAYILKPKAGLGNYEEIREYVANLIQI